MCRALYTPYSLTVEYEDSSTLGIDSYITLTFTMKYHPLVICMPPHISPQEEPIDLNITSNSHATPEQQEINECPLRRLARPV